MSYMPDKKPLQSPLFTPTNASSVIPREKLLDSLRAIPYDLMGKIRQTFRVLNPLSFLRVPIERFLQKYKMPYYLTGKLDGWMAELMPSQATRFLIFKINPSNAPSAIPSQRSLFTASEVRYDIPSKTPSSI